MVGASGNEDVFDGLFFLLSIAAFVVFGVNGNAWREKNLVTRGYMLRGETSAESDEAALAASDLQQSKLPPPPPPRSMKPDPVYCVASNGVDLGEMKVSAIRTAISEGRISYEDHYFDVTANAWRVLQGLAHLET